jgi:hypothetical protein
MKYLKLSNFIKKTFIELTVMEVQGPTSGITFSLAESQGGGGDHREHTVSPLFFP